jgi:hypothetical protein
MVGSGAVGGRRKRTKQIKASDLFILFISLHHTRHLFFV